MSPNNNTLFGASSFRGADFGPLTDNLRSFTSTAFQEINNGVLSVLRARCRYLSNNLSVAHGAVNMIVRRVVGAGLEFYPRIVGPDGKSLRDENRALRRLWKKYKRDVSTRGHKWVKFVKLVLKTYLVDGEVTLVRRRNADKTLSREWQVMEADQYAENIGAESLKDVAKGNKVELGVEMNKAGRPVAYHFFVDGKDLYGGFTNRETERVPASEVLHWSNGNRFGSPRGIPMLTAVILDLNDDEEFTRAVLTQAWGQACFAGFITDPDPETVSMSAEEKDGLLTTNNHLHNRPIGYGTMQGMAKGSEIKFANPTSPPPSYADFKRAVLHCIAAGIGISYLALSRDLTGVSHSGGQRADNDDQMYSEEMDLDMDSEVLTEIWGDFVNDVYNVHAVRSIPSVEKVVDDWRIPGVPESQEIDELDDVFIQHPVLKDIDPLKTARANAEKLKQHVTSIPTLAAEAGKDAYEEFVKQDEFVQWALEEFGVRIDVSSEDAGEDEGATGLGEGEDENSELGKPPAASPGNSELGGEEGEDVA